MCFFFLINDHKSFGWVMISKTGYEREHAVGENSERRHLEARMRGMLREQEIMS